MVAMRLRPARRRLVTVAALLTIVAAWCGAPGDARGLSLPLPGSLVVTISSPSSGSTVAGTIQVAASVTIVGSLVVSGVQFKVDGSNIGSADTSSPYAVMWSTTTVGNGTHTLTAVARDLLGLEYASSPVTVTVSNPIPDTTPPTVGITSPASGATVSGTINVTANASDNVRVAGVQFLLDGAALGAEDTTSPYSVSWNTTTTGNGSHTLTATARDAAGNRTTSSGVTVTVSNPTPDTTPPTVGITSPASGATVSGTINVTASASDNVRVAGVQFLLDGAALGAEDTSSPYSVSWNTTTAGNGSHTLTATARDAAGNRTTSSGVTVTVSNPTPDTTPPNVSITSPASGATVSGTINVTASASDNVGVAGVQFLLDGATLGAEDTSSPYSVSWNTTTAGNGSHTLTATARDAAGNRTTSSGVTVTVSNSTADTTPPTVSITSPASGATVSGTINVTANASDNVGVTGVQFLLDNSALGAEDTTSPYAVPWNTASVANGQHTLTASARDAAGNRTTSAAVTVTVSNAGSDTTPPTVGITSPASGATVSGTIGVSADAADNTGVAGVQFLLDGSALGAEDTSSPYAVAWDTTKSGDGQHTLTATARDAAGNRATSAAVTVTVSNGAPPATTRFEESAATLTPAGGWTPITSAGTGVTLSGGQAVYSGAAGSAATFTFNGTGVTWIGFMCEQCGIANVWLDGAVAATIDTYAPTRPAASGVMFARSGLAAGSHTLSIEPTGTSNASSANTLVVVDAFDVEGSSGGGGGGGGGTTTRVEQDDPSVVYAGNWITQSRSDLSGGSVVEANETGATSSLTFSGTGVSWIGFRGPWAGIAEVYLDGALKATVDTYGPAEQAQVVMYTATGLPSGSHTILIRVTGTWSASSVSAWIVVDAFDVTH